MPSLIDTLLEYDRDILEMVAERWGSGFIEGNNQQVALQIAAFIQDPQNLQEALHSLSSDELEALETLASRKGRQPFDKFMRDFGEIREMGAGRRMKLKPHQTPASITESLFYRGLVGKAYLKISNNLRETIFIPDDLIDPIQRFLGNRKVNSASGFEKRTVDTIKIADDRIIDPVVTYMAGVRKDMPVESITGFLQGTPIELVQAVLYSARILNNDGTLNQTRTRQFLKSERAAMLAHLEKSWIEASLFDELHEISSLTVEIASGFNPVTTRRRVVDLVRLLPSDVWVNINEFCLWVKQHHPDIMRKGGEYDAWLVKEKETGENLSGFENWLSVEGAYIQRLILGPLHTFGLLDLGKRHQEPDFSSFRKSNWFKSLSAGKPPDILAKTNEKLLIEPNGLITIDKQFSPELRYMLARCCTWEKALGNRYIYRIDAAGLKAMRGQGIAVNILINLIQSYGRKPIPENIVKALSRWEINGNESIIRPALLLSVKSGEILDQLCAIPENKWIARRLNATCAELTEGSENQVRVLLLKMGVFADIRPDL